MIDKYKLEDGHFAIDCCKEGKGCKIISSHLLNDEHYHRTSRNRKYTFSANPDLVSLMIKFHEEENKLDGIESPFIIKCEWCGKEYVFTSQNFEEIYSPLLNKEHCANN